VKQILCYAFLLLMLPLAAQQVNNPVAGPYLGLSAYSAANADVFGMNNNPAVLGRLQTAGAGIYAERRFMLQELNQVSMVLALPVKLGGFGLQAGRFGFSGFNETQAGLGYGLQLSDKAAVGGKINYYTQQIAGYGNASTVNFEAGVTLKLTEKLTSGIQAYNPVGGKFGVDKNEKLASVYRLGLGYDVSDKVFLAAELIKEENLPLNVVSALHYQFEKKFFAKIGVSTAASNVFAAAGLTLGNHFRLDVFASHHQQLGFSPGLMLLFNFNKKETR
jgi:hypothetical protein